MVIMHDSLSECALQCMKFCFNIFDCYHVIKWTRFCEGQTHEQMQGGKYTFNRYSSCA